MSSFDLCAQAGADLLSIESTGGKELHDDALLNGDLAGSVSPWASWPAGTWPSCGT